MSLISDPDMMILVSYISETPSFSLGPQGCCPEPADPEDTLPKIYPQREKKNIPFSNFPTLKVISWVLACASPVKYTRVSKGAGSPNSRPTLPWSWIGSLWRDTIFISKGLPSLLYRTRFPKLWEWGKTALSFHAPFLFRTDHFPTARKENAAHCPILQPL